MISLLPCNVRSCSARITGFHGGIFKFFLKICWPDGGAPSTITRGTPGFVWCLTLSNIITHKHTTTTVSSCRILPTNILRDACHTHTHESLACTTLSHTALSHNTLSHTHTYTYTHTPVCRTQHRFSFIQHCRTQLCHTQVCFRQLTDAHHGYASMQYALSLTPSSLPIRLLPPSFFLTSPSHFSRLFPTF